METHKTTRRWRRHTLVACTAAGLVPLVVYWLTCHRAITWWDSAQYSLAADTLGITGAPGSLLLTLLGWTVTRFPLGISPAFALNLLAGLLAAITIALSIRAACDLQGWVTRDDSSSPSWLVTTVIVFSSLPLAFGPTLWTYAVKFTPYVLTATITGTILFTLVRWWRIAADTIGAKWLFIIALLVGLDFSVHRTNALLVPGILFWVLIRQPRAIASIRAWVAGVAGLLVGLSLQLVLMPLASRSPALNMGNPSNWPRLWDYISLQQVGGGFLINVFPRRSGFFDHQISDVLAALGSSFASVDGALLFLGAIPLALAVYGLISMWRKDARLAAALVVLFITTVLTTVAYFNTPESYIRPLHRHYLPCLVIFALISAYGAGSATARLCRLGGVRGVTLSGVMLGLITAVGIGRLVDNYPTHDRSRSYFAYDFASNLLKYLPPDSILLTNGDNDTFPLWYLQFVEGVRPDVNVVNIPLTNTSWYIENVLCGPEGVALSKSAQEMTELRPVPWEEREVALPSPLGDAAAEPLDSVRLRVSPTAGPYLLVQDQVILDMIQTNRWKRPVMIATTVSPASLPWLRNHLSLEGLAYRFVPTSDPGPAIQALKVNLLEHYSYRGYAEPTVHIDETSGMMSQNLYAAFLTLARAARDNQGSELCTEIIEAMDAVLPLDRLQPSEQIVELVPDACETP